METKDLCEGRTIWNSDGTDGPVLICLPPRTAKGVIEVRNIRPKPYRRGGVLIESTFGRGDVLRRHRPRR